MRIRQLALPIMFLLFAAGVPAQNNPDEKEWIQLFNGKDLTGWTPKIRGYDLGVNFNDTFRVENGIFKVSYDKYSKYDERFGHIFYREPFSYYIIAVEYRFVGEQAPAGPGWARRNNGIMVHCQSPESMGKDQDFPISIEVQLLGGLGEGERSTANLCTPGTNVVMNDTLITRHCTPSTSKTFDGDQWVRVEAVVLGDSTIRHIVNGETVLTYEMPQVGGGNVSGHTPDRKLDGKLLSGGYISLQGESAPTEFRRIELLNLEGCMDPRAKNYRKYFVKSDQAQCRY